DKMQSDAEVQNRLGTPTSSGTTEGKQYEDFHTHQKIAYKPGAGYAMGFVMTLGLCDLILFPIEVVKASSEMIQGHDVRVIYEADGKVSAILVDGKYHLGAGQFGSREHAKLWQRLRQSVDGAPSLPDGAPNELPSPPSPGRPLIELPVPPIDPMGIDHQHP